MVDDAVLARSVACFAVVGLVVGVLCTLPLWLGIAGAGSGAGSGSGGISWSWAWLYVLLNLWITRGLHYDGLADVGDAWGSGAQGETFWHILRDSRLGAFGGMALFLGLTGTLLGAQVRLEQHCWAALVLAPVFGRCMAVLLAWAAPPRESHSLGGKACAGATAVVALVHAVLAVACALAVAAGYGQGVGTVVTLAGSAVLLWGLRRLAREQGGSSGDFLGTAIVGGEVVFLLTW